MPIRPGDLTFAHARELIDAVVLVDDAEIAGAVTAIMMRSKLVVEPSGAATVAALMAGRIDARSRRIVAVLSGGNLDPARAAAFLDGR
jgi:threonine dehydratase